MLKLKLNRYDITWIKSFDRNNFWLKIFFFSDKHGDKDKKKYNFNKKIILNFLSSVLIKGIRYPDFKNNINIC